MVETIIGKVFQQPAAMAAGCLVTTSAGQLYKGCDYSFDTIIRHVHNSLERLGLEHLEIVYIHDAMGYR